MPRLDLECANAAAELSSRGFAKKEEKLIADAGAVLAGQGLYAFAVYLRALARKEKKERSASDLLQGCGKLIAFLAPKGATPELSDDGVVALVRSIATDLQKLLLAKKMAAEMLTYLKYQVKGKDDPKKTKGDGLARQAAKA